MKRAGVKKDVRPCICLYIDSIFTWIVTRPCHDHVHQANQNKSEGGLSFHTHSKCCSISCCPSKHHLVMAPKASSTCMPKNTRPLAPPSFPISLDLSSSRILRFSTFQHRSSSRQECRVDHQDPFVDV